MHTCRQQALQHFNSKQKLKRFQTTVASCLDNFFSPTITLHSKYYENNEFKLTLMQKAIFFTTNCHCTDNLYQMQATC